MAIFRIRTVLVVLVGVCAVQLALAMPSSPSTTHESAEDDVGKGFKDALAVFTGSTVRRRTTSPMCALRRQPGFPKPRGNADEFFVTRCTELELQQTVSMMNRLPRATMFIDCGPGESHIRLHSTLRFARLGVYKVVVQQGRVVLDGRGETQILEMGGGGGRMQVFGLAFHRGRSTENTRSGGAISVIWRSTLRVVDCEFVSNRAHGSRAIEGGGAIHSIGGGVTIWNSLFVDNQGATGGAVQISAGNLFVYNSVFQNNFATGGIDGSGKLTAHGGAVRVDRAKNINSRPVMICGCDFEGNSMVSEGLKLGGAIEVFGHRDHIGHSNLSVELRRSKFLQNGVQGDSPNIVMLHGDGDVIVQNLQFVENLSSGQILRIANVLPSSGYTASVQHVHFDGNIDDGRVLRIEGMRCTATHSTFDGARLLCP